MAKKILGIAMLGVLLAFAAPVAVLAQDFTNGTILAQAQGTITVTITGRNSRGETITRRFTESVPTAGQAGGGAAAVARSAAVSRAEQRFLRENPGFQIIRSEVR